MKKLGIGIQELSKLINNGYIYVDKTKIIYNLITSSEYYFLSRPRRFGKSLLVNTLKEIFTGNKEIFKDLWIYERWNWQKGYPVIHIDFTEVEYEKLGLEKALDDYLEKLGKRYQIDFESYTYSGKFIELINKLGNENPVAILIDEYDKPMIDYLEREKIKKAKENRQILKNFYSGVKAQDANIRFFFLTGVSKFSKVSIFSDLNHLVDITTSENFSTMLGYTEEEIVKYYNEYLLNIMSEYKITKKKLLKSIKLWYNGYSWDGENFVYNPFSILNILKLLEFKNYWFETGTPTFLTKLIREKQIDVNKFERHIVSSFTFGKVNIENIDLTSLLFQTGYLTIQRKNIDEDTLNIEYELSYPNKEVRDSFYYALLEQFSTKNGDDFDTILKNVQKSLDNNCIDDFMKNIRSLYSSIPYNIFIEEREGYYHTVLYVLLQLLGTKINCEIHTNKGRLDTIIQTENYIHIIEFKIGSADSAIQQIKDRKYYEPFLNDERRIVLVGIGFSQEERNIDDYKVELTNN